MRKKFFVPSKNEWITLRISASALKTIDKKGIEVVLSEAKANCNTLI
jgi:large subunit ribosomal protein L28